MALKYQGNKKTTVYSAELNNMAYANINSVLSGCEVSESSPAAMTVDITSGKIFFGVDTLNISAVSDLVIAANATSYTRLDVVAIDTSGTISILQGTASVLPAPVDYDPDNYVLIAMVTVGPGVSSITNNDIKDIRVLNIGGGGTGGGTFGRHLESFTSQTSVNVIHNLGDDEPIVAVYDSSDQIIIPESITSNSINDLTVNFSTSTTGKIVVIGGAGVNNAFYTQGFTSQTTVNVNHNMNNENVLVEVIDGSGVTLTPTSITRNDANNVTVVFAGSTTGTVIISGGVSTVGLVKEEPDKYDVDNKSISVTDVSASVTTSLSDINSILIINQGTNVAYIDFDSTSTVDKLPLLARSKLYLRDVNLTTISAICDSGLTTNVKIQFFQGPKIGERNTAQIEKMSLTDTSSTLALNGGVEYRKILLYNNGDEDCYYKFDSSATTNDIPIFPVDYIEIDNLRVTDIAAICNSSKTTDLRILNVYNT